MILELDGIDGVRVRKDVSLAPYTTIGTGGRARFFVEVEKTASLAEVVSGIRRTGVSAGDTFVLGGGANLLVSDDGYDGVILKLMGEFTSVCVEETNARVGAAATIMKLISITEDVGLSGLEFLAGIPGTLGGAVAMNAGAWGKGIWDSIIQVNGVDEGGSVTAICPEDHGVGYRRGNLPGGYIVVDALLACRKVERDEVSRMIAGYLGRRRKLSEDELRTFGSVFRNPEGDFAGRLLEQAGVKGLEAGDAMVSPSHANFIINKGNATSNQVLELISTMRHHVKERFGVTLIPEVVLLGFDKDAIKN